MTRADLQAMANLRLGEAQLLLERGSPSGAYYLAGYAVECALKACIAKSTVEHEFPDLSRVKDSWKHDLTDLVKTAGLQQDLQRSCVQDPAFERSWKIAITWSVESRYRTWQQIQAQNLLQALSDPTSGVMSWITKHW